MKTIMSEKYKNTKDLANRYFELKEKTGYRLHEYLEFLDNLSNTEKVDLREFLIENEEDVPCMLLIVKKVGNK